MNPLHFFLGIMVLSSEKTFPEILQSIEDNMKDTIFDKFPKELACQCISKLLADGMIEMSGESVIMNDETTFGDVIKKFQDGALDDRRFHITKKTLPVAATEAPVAEAPKAE